MFPVSHTMRAGVMWSDGSPIDCLQKRLVREVSTAMCGIAGVLYADPFRPVEKPVLSAMGNAIAHRGPDGEGFFRAHNVGLVHRRLAIIDLAGGDQPIANEDESVQVVFNGEIYNYAELRKQLESRGHRFRTNSDTEVLVHLYEDFGANLVRHLRGMFAFALWDARQRRLTLARDHFGQKPLYVYRDQEKLIFGSELKAILAHPNVDRSISATAMEDYLTFGVIPGESSIFSRIIRLPAAHHLTVSAAELNGKPERYWQLSWSPSEFRSDEQWKECVSNKIRESVRAHLVADVPVGAFLSGGLDSSAIVATISDVTNEPLQTFSIGFQEKQYSELPHAEAVARHFGTIHREEIVTPNAVRDLDDLVHFYDEPFADASAIPTMAVAAMAARHVKVCLSGDGGDEAFGGYSRYTHDLREHRIRQRIPNALRYLLLRPMAAVWPRFDWLPRPLRLKSLLQNLSLNPAAAYANTLSACRQGMRMQLLDPEFRKTIAGHRPESFVEAAFRKGGPDPLSCMLSADTNFLLPDDFLTKVDRASMACGLEVRPPLIDVGLMELAATMPSSLKIREGSKKWIMKELFESRLPAGLVNRPKQGFELPVDDWLRGPLKDQMHSVVLDRSAPIQSFVSQQYVRDIYRSHCNRTGRYGQILWSLLVLGRWLVQYGSSTSHSLLPTDTNHTRADSRQPCTVAGQN
ncbi:MAG: asparagine synthase (glutamine-hydrolyzing) [Planctomycetaceae bacterium]|nr:asparagine synthase (glutamine-hydrolyzing) [Planctomycetaceae bacterium]